MENIVLGIVSSLVIGALVAPIVYGVTKNIVRRIKAGVFGIFDAYIKDPSIKADILAKMLELQKSMASDTGKAKLKAVVEFAKRIIPGKLDDIVVEKIVQAIYDEVIN